MNAVNICNLQKDMLRPMFSEEESNTRVFEGQAYSQFVKYTREVASKTIIKSSIMTFCYLVLTSNANNKYFMDYLIIFPVFKDNVYVL